MANLRNVLKSLGYSEKKIEGVAQLLLMENAEGENAFDKIVRILSLGDSDRAKNENAWIDKLKSWPEIPSSWRYAVTEQKKWNNEGLIKDVLDRDLQLSAAQLFTFLVALTQLQYFGSRFSNFSGITNMYERDERTEISFAVKNLLKKLEFCTARNYCPEDGNIERIFLHAATEAALRKRFAVLKSIVEAQQGKPVQVYYVTNPRGLSKIEKSTAEILASWFPVDRSLQEKIAECLGRVFADKAVAADWYRDLDQLRQKILSCINEECGTKFVTFPVAPNGEKYDPKYDETAKLDGDRSPLGNQWPHVGHLLQHLAKEFGFEDDSITFQVMLVSGKSEENKYIPAKTQDLLEAYFKEKTVQCSSTLYYITDNSVSYAASRQHIMAGLLQSEKGITAEPITYHDALDANGIDAPRVFKEIAAELYTVYTLDDPLFKKLENLDTIEDSLRIAC